MRVSAKLFLLVSSCLSRAAIVFAKGHDSPEETTTTVYPVTESTSSATTADYYDALHSDIAQRIIDLDEKLELLNKTTISTTTKTTLNKGLGKLGKDLLYLLELLANLGNSEERKEESQTLLTSFTNIQNKVSKLHVKKGKPSSTRVRTKSSLAGKGKNLRRSKTGSLSSVSSKKHLNSKISGLTEKSIGTKSVVKSSVSGKHWESGSVIVKPGRSKLESSGSILESDGGLKSSITDESSDSSESSESSGHTVEGDEDSKSSVTIESSDSSKSSQSSSHVIDSDENSKSSVADEILVSSKTKISGQTVKSHLKSSVTDDSSESSKSSVSSSHTVESDEDSKSSVTDESSDSSNSKSSGETAESDSKSGITDESSDSSKSSASSGHTVESDEDSKSILTDESSSSSKSTSSDETVESVSKSSVTTESSESSKSSKSSGRVVYSDGVSKSTVADETLLSSKLKISSQTVKSHLKSSVTDESSDSSKSSESSDRVVDSDEDSKSSVTIESSDSSSSSESSGRVVDSDEDSKSSVADEILIISKSKISGQTVKNHLKSSVTDESSDSSKSSDSSGQTVESDEDSKSSVTDESSDSSKSKSSGETVERDTKHIVTDESSESSGHTVESDENSKSSVTIESSDSSKTSVTDDSSSSSKSESSILIVGIDEDSKSSDSDESSDSSTSESSGLTVESDEDSKSSVTDESTGSSGLTVEIDEEVKYSVSKNLDSFESESSTVTSVSSSDESDDASKNVTTIISENSVKIQKQKEVTVTKSNKKSSNQAYASPGVTLERLVENDVKFNNKQKTSVSAASVGFAQKSPNRNFGKHNILNNKNLKIKLFGASNLPGYKKTTVETKVVTKDDIFANKQGLDIEPDILNGDGSSVSDKFWILKRIGGKVLDLLNFLKLRSRHDVTKVESSSVVINTAAAARSNFKGSNSGPQKKTAKVKVHQRSRHKTTTETTSIAPPSSTTETTTLDGETTTTESSVRILLEGQDTSTTESTTVPPSTSTTETTTTTTTTTEEPTTTESAITSTVSLTTPIKVIESTHGRDKHSSGSTKKDALKLRTSFGEKSSQKKRKHKSRSEIVVARSLPPYKKLAKVESTSRKTSLRQLDVDLGGVVNSQIGSILSAANLFGNLTGKTLQVTLTQVADRIRESLQILYTAFVKFGTIRKFQIGLTAVLVAVVAVEGILKVFVGRKLILLLICALKMIEKAQSSGALAKLDAEVLTSAVIGKLFEYINNFEYAKLIQFVIDRIRDLISVRYAKV